MERVIALARPAERKKRRLFMRRDPWLAVLLTSLGWFIGFWLVAGIVPALQTTAALTFIGVAVIILWERKCGI